MFLPDGRQANVMLMGYDEEHKIVVKDRAGAVLLCVNAADAFKIGETLTKLAWNAMQKDHHTKTA